MNALMEAPPRGRRYNHWDASLGELIVSGRIGVDSEIETENFVGGLLSLYDEEASYPRPEIGLNVKTGTEARMQARWATAEGVYSHFWSAWVDADGTRLRIDDRSYGPLHASHENRATVLTGEDTLEAIEVPLAALNVDGGVRLQAFFNVTGTAGGKTIRVRFGGTVMLFFTLSASESGLFYLDALMFNQDSYSSQRMHGSMTRHGATSYLDSGTAAIDTLNSAQDITITGACLDGNDEIGLQSSVAEFIARRG